MDTFSAYLPIDRRFALSRNEALPETARGAVLFTDISGFTSLTESLVNRLGYQRGAEEMSQYLARVFGVLTAEIVRYRGSVVSSGGDALVSWFDGPEREASHRAVAAAFAMQKSLPSVSTYKLSDGSTIQLNIRSAAACGAVRRFLVGEPLLQVFEVLGGSLLDQVDLAQSMAERGEVVVSAETASVLENDILVLERRQSGEGSAVAVVGQLRRAMDPDPWADIPSLPKEQARPWLHPTIFEYIDSGQEMFLAQLRPSVALFLHFAGIDYERDGEAGLKLNQFFTWVQKRVDHYGGTIVDITTGDKGSYLYIAVGTPHAHEDDPARAVALAHSLLSIPPALGFIRHVRIGISRGIIWSGSIGGREWRTFAALGNEVNLAARLMQAALPGHMLVSERIAEATGKAFHWYLVSEMSVKGISRPVRVYETISTRAVPPVKKFSSPATLIGRETERRLLFELLRQVEATSSEIVVIEGEAGIGKSQLVAELLLQARAQEMEALIGSGYAVEQSTGYHAWRPVFEAVFGLEGGDEGERRREKAVQWIRTRDEKLLERAPLLAPVLSLDAQDNALTGQMTGQVRAENTRALLLSVLQLHVGDSAKLLVLEDAHWFDSASLALAAEAARHLTHVMIVITTRLLRGQLPEHFDVIRGLPQTRHIQLGQLSREEIESLICQRLKVKSLPEQVARLILSKAEGHPFFSEEFAYSLQEAGAIVVEGGECRVTPQSDLRDLNFPDTVQGVIRSRIDRLSPSHQLALKAASVVGRVFALRAVHEIYPLDSEKPHIQNYFEYLRRLDFTPLNSENPDLTYLFKHVITQEVAYNLMTFSQREGFHQAVASWYEKTFPDDLSPYYGVLAYHWKHARNPQKTLEYMEKAGEQAMLHFANREAIEFFQEALQLADSNGASVTRLRRAHWERQLAEAYFGQGELPRSLEHLKRAIRLLGWQTPETGLRLVTTLLGEVVRQVRFRMNPKPIVDAPLSTYQDDTPQAKYLEAANALVRLGHVYYQMNKPFPLIMSTLRAINLAEKAGVKSPVLVRCYTNMCVVSSILPRHDWAWDYRNRAHATGRDVNDLSSLSYAIAGCGTYEIGAALWKNAVADFNEAMEIDARLGDMRHYDEARSLLSIVMFHLGDYRHGLESAPEVLQRAAQRKDIIPQAWAQTIQAEITLRKSEPGTYSRAIAGYEEALKLLEQNIDLAGQIRITGALAVACWRNGDALRALQLAGETVGMAKGNPTAPYALEGYAGPAEVFLSAWASGDENARAAARNALKVLKKYAGVFPLGQPRYRNFEGWFHWLDGKPEKARTSWDASLAEAQRLEMPYEQGIAYLFLGRHSLQGEEKTRALTSALELFTGAGIQHEADVARGLLA